MAYPAERTLAPWPSIWRDRVPDMEYFFCDTGAELPETYKYLAKLEVVLGKPIARLNSDRNFAHYFEVFQRHPAVSADEVVH